MHYTPTLIPNKTTHFTYITKERILNKYNEKLNYINKII